MSEYLIIGDPHCKPDNLYKIEKLFNLVEAKGLTNVWLGDLLDTKDIIRAQCLNAYIHYFRNSNLKHIILVGNHDYTSSECTQHALEALKALNNVTVVDRPYFEGKTLFVPYFARIEDFRASIAPYELPKYLFMHQGVNGCDYGNGFIAENDMDISEVKRFDKVISGHFHTYQVKDNLTYLGTPFSHSFGESNQQKYLGIFYDSDGSLELIKTDFPKHMTVEFHLGHEVLDPIDFYDHNRVLLIGSREQVAEFDRSKYPGIKFIECPRVGPSKSIIRETQSPEDMYTNWFKEIKKETSEELYQLGLDILKDVS